MLLFCLPIPGESVPIPIDAVAPRNHASSATKWVSTSKVERNLLVDNQVAELSPPVERHHARRSGRRGAQRSGIKEELTALGGHGGQPRS